MRKHIAIGISTLIMAAPVFAFADTVSTNAQLISIYTQLIQLLQKELALLESSFSTPVSSASLDISPATGKAPLDVIFTLRDGTGTEAIDYGDGHSTGSNGCARNPQGWCDLSLSKPHTYQLPGTYKVTVYSHPTPTTQKVVSVSTMTVTQ